MTRTWQMQTAKARFSEFLEASLAEGPRLVTKRGVPAAVLVPFEQWRKMELLAKPSLKDVLLAPEARSEVLAPSRRARPRRHRTVPNLD